MFGVDKHLLARPGDTVKYEGVYDTGRTFWHVDTTPRTYHRTN